MPAEPNSGKSKAGNWFSRIDHDVLARVGPKGATVPGVDKHAEDSFVTGDNRHLRAVVDRQTTRDALSEAETQRRGK